MFCMQPTVRRLYNMFLLAHESSHCFETFPNWFIKVGLPIVCQSFQNSDEKNVLLNQKSISFELFALNYLVGYGEGMSFGVRLGKKTADSAPWRGLAVTDCFVRCMGVQFFRIMGCRTNSL